MSFASYLVCQRCALFGHNKNNKCLENTLWCCCVSTQGRRGISKNYILWACDGHSQTNSWNRQISTDYNRATVTEEEVYLHLFMNSSLLHGNGWSASSPGHFIPSRNPNGEEVGWADESVWRRWNCLPVCPIQESNPDCNRKFRISINEIYVLV